MNQVVVKQEKSGYQIVEAYKSLRTNLQFCGEDKKVIAVTSCTPNEGKSSVSMQLGISLAESGKRVILIDADLRKSVLLGRTKTQKSVRGLAHFLSGQATLEDVICQAAKLLRPGGSFYMVHRPFRLVDIMVLMREYHLEPKRMKLVYPYIDKDPNMVLIEGLRGGRPRMTVEKPLIVYKEPGVYTDEIYEIYGY